MRTREALAPSLASLTSDPPTHVPPKRGSSRASASGGNHRYPLPPRRHRGRGYLGTLGTRSGLGWPLRDGIACVVNQRQVGPNQPTSTAVALDGSIPSGPSSLLGAALEAERIRCRLTQVELGRRLGRSQTAVSRWERSDLELTLLELVVMCLALACDPSTILRASRVPRGMRQRSNRTWPRCIRIAIGAAIRSFRVQAAPSSVDLAKQIGVSAYRLWQIESGSDLAPSEYKGIADARVLDLHSVVARAIGLPALEILSARACGIGDHFSPHLAAAFDLLSKDRVREDLVDERPLRRAGP